jgi:hypothetical protein
LQPYPSLSAPVNFCHWTCMHHPFMGGSQFTLFASRRHRHTQLMVQGPFIATRPAAV